MASKTEDLQFAIVMTVGDDRLTLVEMERRLFADYPSLRFEDRRWIGVAVYALQRSGKLVFPECSAKHNHEGNCVTELGNG